MLGMQHRTERALPAMCPMERSLVASSYGQDCPEKPSPRERQLFQVNGTRFKWCLWGSELPPPPRPCAAWDCPPKPSHFCSALFGLHIPPHGDRVTDIVTGCWEVAAASAFSFVVDTKALLKAVTKPMGMVLHRNLSCLFLIISSHGHCHFNSTNCPLK